MHSRGRTFAAKAAEVTEARRFTRDTLQTWNARAWDWTAVLLVSELAANAVLHAQTVFSVELTFDGILLTVRVTDHSPQLVRPRFVSGLATDGRGLALVDQFSVGWGVQSAPASKTVWCTIAAADDEVAAEAHLLSTDDQLHELAERLVA